MKGYVEHSKRLVQMIASLRYALTFITLTLLVLFTLTVETVVDEFGFTEFVRAAARQGWAVMGDSAYANFVLWGLLFFAGGTFFLWAEYAIRKMSQRRNIASRPTNATIYFHAGDKWYDKFRFISTHNVHSWYIIQHSDLRIFIVFIDEIKDGHIYVTSTEPGIKWIEDQLSTRSAVVTIKGNYTGSLTMLEVVSGSICHDRRQQSDVEQDAIVSDAETMQSIFGLDMT